MNNRSLHYTGVSQVLYIAVVSLQQHYVLQHLTRNKQEAGLKTEQLCDQDKLILNCSIKQEYFMDKSI